MIPAGLIHWLILCHTSTKNKHISENSALSSSSCHVLPLWRAVTWPSKWGQHSEKTDHQQLIAGGEKEEKFEALLNWLYTMFFFLLGKTIRIDFDINDTGSTILYNCADTAKDWMLLLFRQSWRGVDAGCWHLADALISADFISIPLHIFDLALHSAIC